MKKIRQVGLNRKVKSILNQLEEISPYLVPDIITAILGPSDAKKYFGEDISYDEAIMYIFGLFKKKLPIVNNIVMDMARINNEYVEEFKSYNLEELENEYKKQLMPSIHKVMTVSPDMIIFYYITNELQRDERYFHALKCYSLELNDFETYKENIKVDELKIKGLNGSIFEKELNDFYNGNTSNNEYLMSNEHLQDLCERYNGTVKDSNITIDHKILSFYDYNAELILKVKESIDGTVQLMLTKYKRVSKILEKTKNIGSVYTQIDKLKNERVVLKNEIKFLNKKLDEAVTGETNKNNIELEKENYYLKSQVEKLQLENQELFQTIKELKEVVEDLPITIDKVEPTNVYEGQSIVVVGGHWSEKEKDNVRASYIADFIEAEDIIKYTNRIKNYDLIVFDTSRNSHINFNRLRNNSKLRLISMSKKDRIDELFVK